VGYRKPPFPDHFEKVKKYQHQQYDAGYTPNPSAKPVANGK
jgi:hypothetical protein